LEKYHPGIALLYQNDISPNHEGEGCGESYSRMIFLQIMRERSVVRAIPG
jgi:hypothetical protein